MRRTSAALGFAAYGCLALRISVAYGDTGFFPLADTAATFHITATWLSKKDDDHPDWPENMRCLAGTQCQSLGTGFEVGSSGTILTAAHLLPTPDMADDVDVAARPTIGQPAELKLSCIRIDQIDLAYCSATDSEPRPVHAAHVSLKSVVSESQQVWIRGCPFGGALEGAGGHVTNVAMPFAKTDAMLFPGYSGGPAYADGEVVGIVHDGQPVAEVNDPRVMGKGRILLLSEVRSRLPASLVREIEAQPTKSSLGWKDILTPYYFAARANHGLLVYRGANVDLTDLAMQSNYTLGVDRAGSITYEEVAPIADWVANLNPDDYAATLNKTSRDTEAVVAGYSGSFFGVPFSLSAGYTTTPRPGDAIPKTLSTAYSIDETNDTHALFAATIKNYSTGRIKATPGYRIVKYDLQVLSATRVSNEQVLLASDGSSIEFKYTLRSEMLGDGRRGWLKARLVFAERKL